jgi:hypothetical protein
VPTPSDDDPVLYIAYGSNLHPARFRCYVSGGRPHGATRTYLGCSDGTPHGPAVALQLPHRLFYAGHSSIWGGSAAFIDPNVDPAQRTPAVGYPITCGQLRDIVAQENGGEAGGAAHLEIPEPGQQHRIDTDGWYDLLVGVALDDGRHGVTFTAHTPPAPNPGTPSAAYLATIAAGIVAHHGTR